MPKSTISTDAASGIQIVIGWGLFRGRWEPRSVMFNSPSGMWLTANTLRQLPIGNVVDKARESVGSVPGSKRPDGVKPGPRRGRAATTADLRTVEVAYKAAWASGGSVTRAVADALGISKSGAAKKIMAARDAGMLTDTGPRPHRPR